MLQFGKFITQVDASYAVWDNTRIHTDLCMSLGWVMIPAKSRKQRLNAQSSTEAELLGVCEYLSYNIHLVSFMKEKGY